MTDKQQKVLEMTKDICRHQNVCNDVCKPISACDALRYAERAVEAGYVKQSEGEWEVCGMFDDFLKCSVCGDMHPWQTAIAYKYCPECGAKMKGGE